MPDKRDSLRWDVPYKRGITVLKFNIEYDLWLLSGMSDKKMYK